MPKILRNHYVLAVRDLEKSAAFFGDLGFAVSSRPPGWILLQRDQCMVMLGDCRDAIKPADLGDHSYFGYLLVDDVNSYHKEVMARGVRIQSPIGDKPWGLREFGVMSPEGHRITIGQLLAG